MRGNGKSVLVMSCRTQPSGGPEPRLAARLEGLDDDHASAAARANVRLLVLAATIGAIAAPARRGRVGYAEEPAGQCDIVGAIGVGEEAVVADAMEPTGQHMDQEAADELVGVERHQLVASVSLGPVIRPHAS